MNEAGRDALRLLFVTPDDRPAEPLLGLVGEVLAGGVTAVLLRERRLPSTERARLYRRLAEAVRGQGAIVLLSRDLSLARDCAAHGVHTGWGGPTVASVRAADQGLLVGRSCHWPPEPEDEAADYVTLSPFRPTPASHPRPLLRTPQVRDVLERLGCRPVLALGGLTADDVPRLPDGLWGVAVMRALSTAVDPRAAARALRTAVEVRWPRLSVARD